jgi:hypothetical protein
MVPDWTAALGVGDTTIREAQGGRDARAADFLTRYVLLYRCTADNLCLRLADLEGPAWAFCMASGTATQLTSAGPGRVVDLPRRYEEADRRSGLLVQELVGVLA